MKIKNNLIVLLSLLFFTACSQQPTKVVVDAQTIPIVHPPLPRDIIIRDVEFEVKTEQQLMEEINRVKNLKIITIDSDYIENLGLNLSDTTRYIKQLRSIIKYYRTLDKTVDNSADSSNNKE